MPSNKVMLVKMQKKKNYSILFWMFSHVDRKGPEKPASRRPTAFWSQVPAGLTKKKILFDQ